MLGVHIPVSVHTPSALEVSHSIPHLQAKDHAAGEDPFLDNACAQLLNSTRKTFSEFPTAVGDGHFWTSERPQLRHPAADSVQLVAARQPCPSSSAGPLVSSEVGATTLLLDDLWQSLRSPQKKRHVGLPKENRSCSGGAGWCFHVFLFEAFHTSPRGSPSEEASREEDGAAARAVPPEAVASPLCCWSQGVASRSSRLSYSFHLAPRGRGGRSTAFSQASAALRTCRDTVTLQSSTRSSSTHVQIALRLVGTTACARWPRVR